MLSAGQLLPHFSPTSSIRGLQVNRVQPTLYISLKEEPPLALSIWFPT